MYRQNSKRGFNMLTVLRYSGSLLIRDERKFGIHEHNRSDVVGLVYSIQYVLHNSYLVCTSFNCLDTWRCLPWIRRIYNHNPIAMPQQW